MLLIAANFLFAIQHEMHLYSFEPRHVHQLAISTAISRLQYGLPGYLGYNTISKTISSSLDHIVTNVYIVDTGLNLRIRDALDLSPSPNYLEATSAYNGTHSLQGLIGPGLVDYYILSFLLFGYQFQSLLYFYFLLLAIQSVIFFLQFRQDDHYIAVLMLFLVAHYMTLTALRFPGNQLDAPNNYRFLPVLAILPMIHICLLALYQHRVSTPTIVSAVAQAALLAFIIHCRSSAYWTLVPVALLAVFALFLRTQNKKLLDLGEMNAPAASPGFLGSLAPRWWPGLLAFGMVFSMGSFYRSQLERVYTTYQSLAAHTFWHPIFIGLALHPDLRMEYSGMVPQDISDYRAKNQSVIKALKTFYFRYVQQGHASDQFSYNAVARKYLALGQSPNAVFGPGAQFNGDSVTFDWTEIQVGLFDREVGKLVWDVVTRHPALVLEEVFIAKPVLFTWYYLTCYIPFKYECAFWGGRNTHLTEPLSLSVIFLGLVFSIMLARKSSNVSLHGTLGILVLSFGCSLIPTLLVYPEPWIIGDAVVVLTMCQLFLVFLFFRAILNKAFASQAATWLTAQKRP